MFVSLESYLLLCLSKGYMLWSNFSVPLNFSFLYNFASYFIFKFATMFPFFLHTLTLSWQQMNELTYDLTWTYLQAWSRFIISLCRLTTPSNRVRAAIVQLFPRRGSVLSLPASDKHHCILCQGIANNHEMYLCQCRFCPCMFYVLYFSQI